MNMQSQSRMISIAGAVAVALGTAFLSPTPAYAATGTLHQASSCETTPMLRHLGPPGKGFAQITAGQQCPSVEFAAFETSKAGESDCKVTLEFRHSGPPGKGFDYPVQTKQC